MWTRLGWWTVVSTQSNRNKTIKQWNNKRNIPISWLCFCIAVLIESYLPFPGSSCTYNDFRISFRMNVLEKQGQESPPAYTKIHSNWSLFVFTQSTHADLSSKCQSQDKLQCKARTRISMLHEIWHVKRSCTSTASPNVAMKTLSKAFSFYPRNATARGITFKNIASVTDPSLSWIWWPSPAGFTCPKFGVPVIVGLIVWKVKFMTSKEFRSLSEKNHKPVQEEGSTDRKTLHWSSQLWKKSWLFFPTPQSLLAFGLDVLVKWVASVASSP